MQAVGFSANGTAATISTTFPGPFISFSFSSYTPWRRRTFLMPSAIPHSKANSFISEAISGSFRRFLRHDRDFSRNPKPPAITRFVPADFPFCRPKNK